MQIPEEFNQFVIGIYPGIPHDWKSAGSQAGGGLEMSSAKERRVVLGVPECVAGCGYSDADMRTPGMCSLRATNFSAGGHRVFLEIVRRQDHRRQGP